MERKKLLEKSSEQERLLAEIPKVIADELEPEATSADTLEKEEENSSSPKSHHLGDSNINFADDAGEYYHLLVLSFYLVIPPLYRFPCYNKKHFTGDEQYLYMHLWRGGVQNLLDHGILYP